MYVSKLALIQVRDPLHSMQKVKQANIHYETGENKKEKRGEN